MYTLLLKWHWFWALWTELVCVCVCICNNCIWNVYIFHIYEMYMHKHIHLYPDIHLSIYIYSFIKLLSLHWYLCSRAIPWDLFYSSAFNICTLLLQLWGIWLQLFLVHLFTWSVSLYVANILTHGPSWPWFHYTCGHTGWLAPGSYDYILK